MTILTIPTAEAPRYTLAIAPLLGLYLTIWGFRPQATKALLSAA